MNILNIALKEIKTSFRDMRTFVMMLGFPLVLMLILGTALSNAFNTKVSVNDIQVLYKDQSNGSFSTYFQLLTKEAKKSGVHFHKATQNVNGKKEVAENQYDAYVEVNQHSLTLYESDRNSIEGSIIQGMLTAFTDKYHAVSEISKVNPSYVKQAISSAPSHNYIHETSLNQTNKPGAMDYYAISMTTMIAFFAAISASYLLRGERLKNTADRLISAPITKADIFLGKLLGSIVTHTLTTLIVVLFSKIVFKAHWGNHLGMIFIVLLTEIILAISFGLGVGYIAKTGGAGRTIVMITVQIAAMFGGAYYQTDDVTIAQFSPLKWANDAIMNIIYTNHNMAAIHAVSWNLGLSVLFLFITIISLRRREGL